MVERALIEYCSATLASLKAGSLFNEAFQTEEELSLQLAMWNRCLTGKGIRLFVLRKSRNHALIYVYRRNGLRRILARPEIAGFLAGYGYRDFEVDAALQRLRKRMTESDDFPHEIGVFLDYPLGDVIGFIANGGRNFKCAGCWKVYCDECGCRAAFARYRKCRDVYMRLWQNGRSVWQLTVAA